MKRPKAPDAVTLRLWDDGNDFVIAETAEEANALWLAHTGEPPQYFDSDVWEAWEDERVFTFVDEDDRTKTSRPAREWCAEHGKGYFASRDY